MNANFIVNAIPDPDPDQPDTPFTFQSFLVKGKLETDADGAEFMALDATTDEGYRIQIVIRVEPPPNG